jgi:hypothetical protein
MSTEEFDGRVAAVGAAGYDVIGPETERPLQAVWVDESDPPSCQVVRLRGHGIWRTFAATTGDRALLAAEEWAAEFHAERSIECADCRDRMPVQDVLKWATRRLVSHDYGGGLHGTCYQCPFASAPLDSFGDAVPFGQVANDPTEAYFRCSLPTREESKRLSWGEYAPCTDDEWLAWIEQVREWDESAAGDSHQVGYDTDLP